MIYKKVSCFFFLISMAFVLAASKPKNPTKTTVDPIACSECTHVISTSTYIVDGDELGLMPGDVVCFDGTQAYNSLILRNIVGEEGNEVIIKNCGGQVAVLDPDDTAFGLKVENSSYFKILGNGGGGDYGIKISTDNGFFLTLQTFTTNFEIANVEIAGKSSELSGFAGIGIKTSPYEDCDAFANENKDENWIMRDISVHDNYIHDVGGEGLYIGHGFYNGRTEASCDFRTYAHSIRKVRIYNNLIENVGYDGIQIKNSDEDVLVYNNVIDHYALNRNTAHDEGIYIGDGTTGDFYNNWVNDGGAGIFIHGMGNSNIYNNVVLNTYDYALCAYGGPNVYRIPDGYFNIFNNTFHTEGDYAFVFYEAEGGPKRLKNNIFLAPASTSVMRNGVPLDSSNNIATKDNGYLQLMDLSNGDLSLASGSPAIDAGEDLSAYGVLKDFLGYYRESGNYDIGAYELQRNVINGSASFPGNALSFDGGDAVDLGDAPSLSLAGESLTLEAWIYLAAEGSSGTRTVVGKYDLGGSNDLEYVLQVIDGTYSIQLDLGEGGSTFSSLEALEEQRWYHIAASYDGSEVRLYLNGVLDRRFDQSGTIVAHSEVHTEIGAAAEDQAFLGKIDEVRIWNVARSASGIHQYMEETLSGSEAGLAAYYRFEEGQAAGDNTGMTSGEVFDWTVNDNDGNMSGFAKNGSSSNWVSSTAQVHSIDWNGTADGAWKNVDNWADSELPSKFYDVTITNNGHPLVLGVGTEVACNSLHIEPSASVTVESGASLAIFGNTFNAGSYTIEKNVTSEGFGILGAPVQDANFNDMEDADFIYTYENSTGTWSRPSGNMLPAVGYFVGHQEAEASVRFSGTPNGGTISYDYTENSGYELVANPYAAAIEVEQFILDNGTVSTLYLWDDGGADVNEETRGGDYIAVTAMGAASSVEPNGVDDGIEGLSGSGPADDGYIASLQGFFVDIEGSGTITFRPRHQSIADGSNDDSDHYRTTESTAKRVKLAMRGQGFYNEIVVGFHDKATIGIDRGYDGKRFESADSPFSFYTLVGSEQLAIQAIPQHIKQVPLLFDAQLAGSYKISVVSLEGLQGRSIVLRDHLRGLDYTLVEEAEVGFTVDATTMGSDRFELLFDPVDVLESGNGLPQKPILRSVNNQLQIQYPSNKVENIAIYTVSGKVVFEASVRFREGMTTLPVEVPHDQLYLLKISNSSTKFILKK